jgi:hypothetical protein
MSKELNRLVRRVKTIDRNHQKYKLLMKYDGETIAEYDMSSGERTIDIKTPEQWVRGNMCFLITLKGKDETKVEIEKIKP